MNITWGIVGNSHDASLAVFNTRIAGLTDHYTTELLWAGLSKDFSNIPLKGKKNKRRSTKESDWRTYWGSSEHLLADVEKLGEDKFTREILHYCQSRGMLSYLEAKEQFDREVLLSDDYYNGIINVRVGSSKVLQEHLCDFVTIPMRK